MRGGQTTFETPWYSDWLDDTIDPLALALNDSHDPDFLTEASMMNGGIGHLNLFGTNIDVESTKLQDALLLPDEGIQGKSPPGLQVSNEYAIDHSTYG